MVAELVLFDRKKVMVVNVITIFDKLRIHAKRSAFSSGECGVAIPSHHNRVKTKMFI